MGEPQPIRRAEHQEEPRRSPLLPILGLVAILAIIIVLLLLLRQPAAPEVTPTATSIVAQATDGGAQIAVTDDLVDETLEVESSATDAVETEIVVDGGGGTEEGGQSDLSGLYAALAEFSVEDGAIAVSETSAGSALLATVCSASGAQLRDDLPAAMLALSSATGTLETEASLIGVRMVDCTTNTLLRTVVVNVTDAITFANGGLDTTAFQTRWQSL
jgi:hypothetical protein